MDPFKVTFTFLAPIFVDSEYPLHLDALIAYAVMRDAEKMGAEDPWREAEDLSVCLARTNGEEWVWKASRLVFTPLTGFMFTNMVRRALIEQAYDDLGKFWIGGRVNEKQPMGINEHSTPIKSDSGQQRGYQLLTVSQWVQTAEAWGVGEIEAVRYYLNTIRYIGKQGRNGYGQIKSIVVEPCPEGNEKWRLRNLPEKETGLKNTSYEPVISNLRPPYWKKTTRSIIKEPMI